MSRRFGMIEKHFVQAKKRITRRIRETRVLNTPYYFKYPYRSKVSILDANPRGAISLDRRFFYNRVPKSANSNIMAALIKISGKPVTHADAIRAKGAFTRPSELSSQDLAQFDDFFKFTFVRNPYTRVLSAYLDKIATGIKVNYLRGIDTLPGFSQFCTYLDSGGLHMNAHWAPQTSLMLLPIDRFDFIGKVESFNRDLSVVASNVALEDPSEPMERFNKRNADSKIEKYYDDQCREIVRRLYRSDFECFGYEM